MPKFVKLLNFKMFGVLLIALMIRIVSAVTFGMPLAENSYIPFITYFLENPTLDPWATWTEGGNQASDFPYGPPMLSALSIILGLFGTFSWWGYFCFLLASEALLLISLSRLGVSRRILAAAILFSPVQILSIFGLGSNDVLVAALVMQVVVQLKKGRFLIGGVLTGLVIGLKPIAILAAPLLLIYAFRKRDSRANLARFITSSVSLAMFGSVQFLYSSAYRLSITGSSELKALLEAKLTLTPGPDLYLVPIIILGLGVYLWRTSAYDLLSLSTISAAVFLIIGGLPFSPPGWIVLTGAFLAISSKPYSFRLSFAVVLVLQFQLLPRLLASETSPFRDGFVDLVGDQIKLWDSFVFLISLGLSFALLARNLERPLASKSKYSPISIAIAGDSGVGKDTLVESLSDLFGRRNIAHLSGDDYHKWGRKSGEWKYLTHLHPRANELTNFFASVQKLMTGRQIRSLAYDHATGVKKDYVTIKPKPYLILSGLHALSSSKFNSQFDLGVFLAMEEELRSSIKIHRDTSSRSQSAEAIRNSINRRIPDYKRFVEPQSQNADLEITLSSYSQLENLEGLHSSFCLDFAMGEGHHNEDLFLALRSTPGLSVANWFLQDTGRYVYSVSGTPVPGTFEAIFHQLGIDSDDVFTINPVWHDGSRGLIQLVVSVHLLRRLSIQDRMEARG